MTAAACAALGLAACSTTAVEPSGLLSGYEGLTPREDTVRAAIRERRDEALASGVDRLFIEPAILAPGAGEGLTDLEQALVLREVDRQICYEVSERFTVLAEPGGLGGVGLLHSRPHRPACARHARRTGGGGGTAGRQ